MIRIITSVLVCLIASHVTAAHLDVIRFGDSRSEQAHRMSEQRSETISGALGLSARQLLPQETPVVYGGQLEFDVVVDPQKPTYFTVKIWGGDSGMERGRLLLLCDGKQVGMRHIGDVDCLDIMSDSPRFPGGFTYVTTILPKAMTAGKQSVRVQIRSLGRIWGYGDTWDKFQKVITEPSRGIYAAFTHTDAMFVPPAEDATQKPSATLRTSPGPEVLEAIKQRVNSAISAALKSDKIHQMQMQLLARAYYVTWTPAYKNQETIDRLIRAMDALYLQYKADPKLAQWDPATYNADWFGFGPMGDVLRLVGDKMTSALEQPVINGDGIGRRDAYAEMLLAAREWHRHHRRQYTNQSMIKDLYGIYLANRGLQVVAPGKAMPEAAARRYLYESVGLQPWLGNDLPDGTSAKPLGDSYMQLTSDGLTRELGYVGSYGEVLDWATSIYEATRQTLAEEGDPLIRQQLVKMAKARAAFRHPLLDADGHPAMVLETVVGWRDSQFPGYITYGQRPARDANPFEAAVATMDPELIGYAQQMIEDNQYFNAMEGVMKEGMFRVTAGLLFAPDHYEAIRALPRSEYRLPMSPGAKDYVFADEENGVVAIRRGDETIYVSLYWRARYAVNFLAKVHHLTPTTERDATVWQDVVFDDSGMKYTRNGRTIEPHSGRHEKNAGLQQALEGEVLPIARIPDGIKFKPGDENIHAGKGTFYRLQYGPYLIAMNMTADREFPLPLPSSGQEAKDMVSGRSVKLDGTFLKVSPRSTVVIWNPQP